MLLTRPSHALHIQCDSLYFPQVTDRNVENLSGGELQRFAIAVVAAQEGEPRPAPPQCWVVVVVATACWVVVATACWVVVATAASQGGGGLDCS